MAYAKKYYYQFAELETDDIHIVELWQDGFVGVAEEITGGSTPFVSEMPAIDNKFQVVRGRGCGISILSATDMKFIAGLYHVDPQEFQVRHYINGSIEGLYYLNSEMFREPYDINFNYIVETSGNDGFALAERFTFLDATEAKYTGIKSKWELLQIVLNKIALPWTEVRVSLSTTFASFSAAADSTILHESYIDSANFYDEDDKPMSLREVLESILAPYGAFICSEGGNIYITDIHTLAGGGSVTYQRFNASTYAYIADVVVSNEKAVSTIGYLGTGQSIEVSGGINRQVVAYSPYPYKIVLDKNIASLDEFATIPASFSTKNGFFYRTLEDNAYWNVYSPATFEESYPLGEEDHSNIYLRWPVGITNQKVADLKVSNFVSVLQNDFFPNQEDYAFFTLYADVLLDTKNNPYDDDETGTEFRLLRLYTKLKIGDDYYPGWSTDTYFEFDTTEFNNNISDRFVPIGFNGNNVKINVFKTDLFSVAKVLNGDLQIEIWSDILTFTNLSNPTIETNPSTAKEIWLKNIKLEFGIGTNDQVPDLDVEYIGLLNKSFKNEGDKVYLTCGTNKYYSDKGKILSSDGTDYYAIKTWTRNTQTFNLEKLLLGSICSNYSAGFYSLDNMKLKRNFSLLNVITDTYISGSIMMVKNAKIDYRNHVVECNLVEISQDDLTIVEDITVR